MKPKIICHGGAQSSAKRAAAKLPGVRRAARAGHALLREGGSALDAVTRAVSVLEDDPRFNAGTGSYVQMDGICRMDASIMDSTYRVGAVLQIDDVRNPIQVARRVLDLGVHAVLHGDLASDFARAEGFPQHDPRTPEKLALWLRHRRKLAAYRGYQLILHLREEIKKQAMLGTVGAVAIDEAGTIAAATSTGGLAIDLPGRVGDVPLIGCGTYADPCAGVSCTGIGEKIIRVVLAREVTHHVEHGLSAPEACAAAIRKIGAIGGRAGVIAIDRAGRVGHAYNSAAMAVHGIG
jgi:beta-aspartyl-peptidase (threonine type)